MSTQRILAGASSAVLIAGLVVAAAPAAQATVVFTWTGDAGDSLWSTEENWTPLGVPDQQSEDARLIEGAQVYVDKNIDINVLRMDLNSSIQNSGGSLKATVIQLVGGSIDMPVQVGTLAVSGETGNIGSSGRVNATLNRGGESGSVVVLSTLLVAGSGAMITATSQVRISGRIDGRGGTYPTVQVNDQTCPDPSITCGVVVETPSGAYGAAMEGITLVSSNIVFGADGLTLALREGKWTPRSGVTVRNASTGTSTLETGSAYPPGESGTPDEDVNLPTALVLSGVTWNHHSGTVSGNGAMSPGASSGTFGWRGGVISGRIRALLAELGRIRVVFDGGTDNALLIDGPTKGSAGLVIEGGGEIVEGTTIALDEVSTFENKSPASSPLVQHPNTAISVQNSGYTVPKVINAGTWKIASPTEGQGTARIEDLPFTSSGSLVLDTGGVLQLKGDTSSSLSGSTTVGVASAESFGRIDLAAEAALKLGGQLQATVQPSAGLESGDALLVVNPLGDEDAEPGKISGDFSPVVATGLSEGLGMSGDLTDEGYVLDVGASEQLALAAKAAKSVKVKKPWEIFYEIRNESDVTVSPRLNLPNVTDGKITTPRELTCTKSGEKLVCELEELKPGSEVGVTVFVTYRKPGKKTFVATATSLGSNPHPERATAALKVTVTSK